jgi:predicted phosphate transport protein (TIGR00153 family)
MALQGLVRWLLPKEDHFYDYIEAQGALCLDAAKALAGFKEGQKAEAVRDAVQVIEHKADDFVKKMEDALARTFVTPIDREDLQRINSELDDVVDLCNLAARACAVYGVQQATPEMAKLMDLLVQCTAAIKESIPHLRKHDYAAVIEASRTLRQLEKDADVVFRGAVSRLFTSADVDAKELLRQKEVLEDIERAVDHCDNVADLLSNLAVKHG